MKRIVDKVLKIGLLILIIGGLLWFGIGFLLTSQCISCKTNLEKVPSIADAPYLIQTPSRIYYTKDYKEIQGGIIITGFYEAKNGRWYLNKNAITLTKQAFGEIKVTLRTSAP